MQTRTGAKCILNTILATATVASLAAAPASAAQDRPDGGNTLIRVQDYPGSTLGIPLWVAIAKNFCQNYNIRCATVNLASGPLGLQTLAAGSIEATIASNEVTLMAASRGNDVQFVVGHTPNNYYTLNVHADHPLPNRDKGYPAVMHDLKGAKVGVTARGAGIEIVMRTVLTSPDTRKTFAAQGSSAAPSTPKALAERIRSEAAMWQAIVSRRNISNR